MSEESQNQGSGFAPVDSGNGGQVTAPTPKPVGVPMDDQGRYLLKVGDQQTPVTVEELYQKASLANGAMAKMQEASNIRKGTVELLRKVDSGDAEAYGQLMDLLEMPAEQKTRRVQLFKRALEATRGGGQPAQQTQQQARPAQDYEFELPPDVQKAASLAKVLERYTPEQIEFLLDQGKDQFLTGVQTRRTGELKNLLASDPTLGILVKKGGPRASALEGLALEKLESRIREGHEDGPVLRAAVMEEVRDFARQFGTFSDPTSFPGLGRSPSGAGFTDAQATGSPERRLVSDPKHSESVLARMAAMVNGD